MMYERRPSETDDELFRRICADKKKIGTWDKVASVLNETFQKDLSESCWRKRLNPNKPKPKCDNPIDLQRIKVRTELLELNKLKRSISRQELFYENIGNKIEPLPQPMQLRNPYCKTNGRKTHVLTIADIHCGAEFSIRGNQYSINECIERFSILESHVVDYIKKNNVTQLTILNLGDNIQGLLRVSDIKLNETSVVESIVKISQILSTFLNDISAYCDIDYYHVPTSNHTQTRNLGTKRDELKSEDVEFVIKNYIKDCLRNNNHITVHTDNKADYIEVPIGRFNAIACHGHTIKSISNFVNDISNYNRVFYDFAFVAHFHAGREFVSGATETNDIETFVANSFIGTCPYSESLLKSATPSCKLFVFDDDYGHIESHKFCLRRKWGNGK